MATLCASTLKSLAEYKVSKLYRVIATSFTVSRTLGVFFRKHTKKEADRLGLGGWIRNTERDTVEGTVEGPSKKCDEMKDWLRTKGSPHSRIDRAEFSDAKPLGETKFNIKR